MKVRGAKEADLERVGEVYEAARSFMRSQGNFSQWTGGYPSAALLRRDAEAGNLYVICEGERIVGAFSFIRGEDPTYAYIEGKWRSEKPYGVIHRLGSDGSVHGIARCCFDFCKARCSYLRVDTHADNKPMQGAVAANGFSYCGVIYLEDGSPRLAYDFLGGKE